MPVEQVAVPIVFLGRDELGAPAEPIANPFFFQIERSDIFDASDRHPLAVRRARPCCRRTRSCP